MTVTSPTRRERLRTATVAEIKDLARRLLVSGGCPAISLRAIARDMGMTAPAIYRYFPSLDALIGELTADLFEELRVVVETARDVNSTMQPLEQLLDMARSFRRWCIAHPAEFELMFGGPVPGVASFEVECVGPNHAGARFGAPFLEVFAQIWHSTPFPTPPGDAIRERLGPQLRPYTEAFGTDVPVEVVYAYLSSWIRLYGVVAMEVFGHLRWAVTDVEPLFEMELATFAALVSPRVHLT
jgi:AcrR family transcriptional regulator